MEGGQGIIQNSYNHYLGPPKVLKRASSNSISSSGKIFQPPSNLSFQPWHSPSMASLLCSHPVCSSIRLDSLKRKAEQIFQVPKKKSRLNTETQKKEDGRKKLIKEAEADLQKFQEALYGGKREMKNEMEIDQIDENEILNPFNLFPEEIFQWILGFINQEKDIKNLASISKSFRERILNFFGPYNHGAKPLKSARILAASENYYFDTPIRNSINVGLRELSLFSKQNNRSRILSPKSIDNVTKELQYPLTWSLSWVKKRLIVLINKGSEMKLKIIERDGQISQVQLNLLFQNIRAINPHCLLVTLKDESYIIYDLSKQKILGAFEGELKILSDQKLIFIKSHGKKDKMVLIDLEEEQIFHWNVKRSTKKGFFLLVENKIIIDDNQKLKIYDFSSKKIHSIPQHLFMPLKGSKKVTPISKNEIIVHVGSSSTLFKLRVPDDLSNEKGFSVKQKINLKGFLDTQSIRVSKGVSQLGHIKYDPFRKCLWISTRSNVINNGVIKMEVQDLSFQFFLPELSIQRIPGGEIHILGHILLKITCEGIQVWQIEESTLKYLYSMTKSSCLTFNQEMTAFAYLRNHNVIIKDYLAKKGGES